jgi:hypothetical protein
MKVERKQYGVSIFLDWNECREIKNDLAGWGETEEPSRETSVLFFELDELLGREEEHQNERAELIKERLVRERAQEKGEDDGE